MAVSVQWNSGNGLANGNATDADMINDNFDDLVTYLNTDVVIRDNSVPFTAIPSGPATNPTTDNQFTRKKYVDDKIAADIAAYDPTNITLASNGTNSSQYLVFVAGATGSQITRTNAAVRVNPASGQIAATQFSGNGALLTNLDADAIATGTVSNSRLPATVSQTQLTASARVTVSGNGSESDPAFRGSDGNTGLYFDATGGIGSTNAILYSCNGTRRYRMDQVAFTPMADQTYDLGASGATWDSVYSGGAQYHTSDERIKTRLRAALGLDFINDLGPFTGAYNRDGLERQFLSAQDVKAALDKHGIDTENTGMWHVGDPTEECPDGRQFIDYVQLVPALIRAVQELSDKVDGFGA